MSASKSISVPPPDSSRASTPQPGFRREYASTPPPYASDPKFKKYTQQVEKCLNSFDSVQEWADFISFLKQLLKTFQSYTQFKEIPKKLVVAKRLSQCLNPALPTGVHQRALDVYSHIFAVLGTEGLQKDLALWSSGLFPFFEYAATSVKPTLLNIFDTHYLPLQTGLRPVMKAFILALLPGLEEETGEYFEKVLGLLDRLSGTVSPSFFLQNIWLIMLTSPNARGTALTFLSRRLPRLNANEDIAAIVGRDTGLMIRAFAAALDDDDLLVRRAALDILLQSLRVDSVAVKKAQADDRSILMRAATSVVLRRDLALNRRLYSWLLGPDENTKHQVEYLKENALELLKNTLKDEMFQPSVDYSQSRPFKIFISLLDKWEIDSLLTEVLVLDAFRAIKHGIDSGADPGEDLIMTANTLYESVAPLALWRQLLRSVLDDIFGDGASCEGINLVHHMLTTYHSHDEETETVHLPVNFIAILDVLAHRLRDDPSHIFSASTHAVLLLLQQLLKRIPSVAMVARPGLGKESKDFHEDKGPYQFACYLYGLDPPPLKPDPQQPSSTVPFTRALQDLVALNSIIAHQLSEVSQSSGTCREAFLVVLDLLSTLVVRLEEAPGMPATITWNPSDWLSVVLPTMEHKAAAFVVVDRLVSTIVQIQQTTRLEPNFAIDRRHLMSAMINPLLRYLRPQYSAYHVRAVNLIWTLEKSSKTPHVESIIANSLSSQRSEGAQEACEAFGVLWRLTEDSMLPGFRLKVPMTIVLDSLKSDDPHTRRIAETWMRCSLKSYLRVLDPILFDLHDLSIIYSQTTTEVNGREIQGFHYVRPFDQRYMVHLLDTLLSVVKFGGQGFSKIARSTPTNRSVHAGLVERLQSVSGSLPEASYMDVITALLLRFLQSEPKPSLAPKMNPFNAMLQATAADLLQALIVRGEVELVALQAMESVIIGKLYLAVHQHRLDLQNKLLHLLHSIISGLSTQIGVPAPAPAPASKASKAAAERTSSSRQYDPANSTATYTIHPLFTQTLQDGISEPANRPLLQHWLDFVMMTVPQFQSLLASTIAPLNDTVCRQLRGALADISQASAKNPTSGDIIAFTTDSDFLMLLNTAERLVLLSLSSVSVTSQEEEESPIGEKQETSGLLGYVSGVFSSESGQTPIDDPAAAKLQDYRCLYDAMRVLYSIWGSLAISPANHWVSEEESLSLIYNRARTRCRRVLEHLFRVYSSEVLEAIVDCWSQDSHSLKEEEVAAFELVDILTSSAQNVVHMICESIAGRTLASPERSRRPTINPNLSDLTLFDFLEQYCRRLEGPVAVQVWGRFMQLAKDLSAAFREFKVQAFSALRCFTVLADKITQSAIVEDRRVRKDLQEVYTKLVDVCLLAGRATDSTWIRRGNSSLSPNTAANGRDSPITRTVSDTKLDEKMNASTTSFSESLKPSWGIGTVDQVNVYIASEVLPNLRKFLVDGDKILVTCNNMVYNVVTPAMKGRTRPLDVDEHVLLILREMTRIAAGMKAWRGPVVDVLNDNRCFNSTPAAGGKWRPMVKMLFDTDKTALSELLSKITTAPSTNIFTNREYEMLLRSLNLRRLAYVILAGDKNHFLTQLPTIQEKLVDTLRNVSAPIVQSEVYLCVRVLLCRLSPHNLSSFWPVILTELYRVYEQVMVSIPSDGSEDLAILLSASKLLDLLLVLQTQEFQIHQWIFITDTVDAIYHPDDWFPEAMLDRLAEIVGELPAVEEGSIHALHSSLSTAPSVESHNAGRRPMLNSVRQIDSIRDLIPFFTQVSMASYESVYGSGGNVDWEAVEQGLLDDMFDGR